VIERASLRHITDDGITEMMKIAAYVSAG
jgi:hypothetical protein